eukprot:COSAG02_NODE_10767_length_1862_cov_1.387408_1_plen_96_part_00
MWQPGQACHRPAVAPSVISDLQTNTKVGRGARARAASACTAWSGSTPRKTRQGRLRTLQGYRGYSSFALSGQPRRILVFYATGLGGHAEAEMTEG